MTESIQQQAISILQKEWAEYGKQFHSLTPETQTAFLARQGYARFADLLAHIIAWWSEGLDAIEAIQLNPAHPAKEYDIDAFNAKAVMAAQAMDGAEVEASFERLRERMLHMALHLPESAATNQRILERLKMEVIGHYAEHALPAIGHGSVPQRTAKRSRTSK